MTTRILVFLLALSARHIGAQNPLQGTVTDPQGMPLAFVTVLLNDEPGKGVLTDIEGRFSFGPGVEVRALGFRYVGYEPRRVDADFWKKAPEKPLVVVLQPADNTLPEAVIRAGENPADILIRKAIAHRRRNNPEMLPHYTCTTYNKVLFDVLPNRAAFEKENAEKDTARESVRDARQGFADIEQHARERHVFLMESVTDRAFLFPNQVQENVQLNRVSGFENAGFVALANMVQPFSFYGDYLTILDKNYVNPISPGSPDLYFFHIEDTLLAGSDTVWVISFHPRKGKVFEGFEGVLHLHERGWAIQNVRAQPANPGNLHLKIEQAYQMVFRRGDPRGRPESDDLQWFPAQLNFEMEFREYPSPYIGIRAAGRSYITDVRLDTIVRPRDIHPERPVLQAPTANTRADSAWSRWRDLSPLSTKETGTYVWLDSLGDSPGVKGFSNLMDVLVTGLLPLGNTPASLDFRRLLRFNEYEGVRLGIGLTTMRAHPLLPPRRLELGINAGYGFRDKNMKYGGYALWRVVRTGRASLRLDWSRDLWEPGAPYEIPPTAFFDRSLYARRMDRVDEFTAALGSHIGRYLFVEGSFRKQDLRPGYAYRYGSADAGFSETFRFTEATFSLRYSNGERKSAFFSSDVGTTQRLPVVELAYTRGWRGLWDGGYDYERWTAVVYHAFFLGKLGRTRWRVEAGVASADAPLAKLFTLNQTGKSVWNVFVLPNTFQALPDTVFLSDRFVNLYLAQEVGPVFYRAKHSAPALTLLQNIAWGDLRRPDLHHDLGFRTAATALFESGVQLDNLLRFNYLNVAYLGIGGAVFYRWGGLQAEQWRDNLSFRATMRFSL